MLRKLGLPLTRACLVLCGLLLSSTTQASLDARLSSTEIDETQTLELTIRTDSRDVQGTPDMQGVTGDFEILTTRTSSQYRIINGKVQAWTDWIVALRPRRTGTLTVPALSYRGEHTQPLTLEVIPLDPALKKQMSDRVFFETTVEPEEPYVQAQVLFTRRLLYADGTQIYGEMPDTPVVENAVVIPLDKATATTVTRNNTRYGMIEQRYALFPERSGELKIPGAIVSGSVRMNVNGRLRRNGVRVVAEPLTLSVRPIPPEYPKDTPWLPATRVDLVEAWDPAPPAFALGEPISQTLIVRADAATGSLIPPLDYPIPDNHFRSYPEQPDIADSLRGGGLVGTRSQTFSLIPTQLGQTTLPMLELTWFDTVRDEVRTSRLASRPVNVIGGSSQLAASDESLQSAENVAPQATPEDADSVMASDRAVFSGLGALLLSAAIALVLWLCWPWLQSRLDLKVRLPSFVPAPVRKKRAKDSLLDAAANGSATEIRDELRNTQELFADNNSAVNNQALERINQLLSQASYAREKTELDRDALTAAVEALFTSGEKARTEQVLPTLYPS